MTRTRRCALGRQHYDQQQYAEAFKLFSMLVANDHTDGRYVMALGAAGQMIGRHQDALTQYMAASALMMGHPQPVFHSAQCLIELGHADMALETLELALSLCVEDEHAPFAGHIQQLIERLRATETEELFMPIVINPASANLVGPAPASEENEPSTRRRRIPSLMAEAVQAAPGKRSPTPADFPRPRPARRSRTRLSNCWTRWSSNTPTRRRRIWIR